LPSAITRQHSVSVPLQSRFCPHAHQLLVWHYTHHPRSCLRDQQPVIRSNTASMAQDKRTEKEKMLTGELYYAFEKTLLDERQVGDHALASSMLPPRHGSCCTARRCLQQYTIPKLPAGSESTLPSRCTVPMDLVAKTCSCGVASNSLHACPLCATAASSVLQQALQHPIQPPITPSCKIPNHHFSSCFVLFLSCKRRPLRSSSTSTTRSWPQPLRAAQSCCSGC
jgi:hypothetical protein